MGSLVVRANYVPHEHAFLPSPRVLGANAYSDPSYVGGVIGDMMSNRKFYDKTALNEARFRQGSLIPGCMPIQITIRLLCVLGVQLSSRGKSDQSSDESFC